MSTFSCSVNQITPGSAFTINWTVELLSYKDDDSVWISAHLVAYNGSTKIGQSKIKDIVGSAMGGGPSTPSGSTSVTITRAEIDTALSNISGASSSNTLKIEFDVYNFYMTDMGEWEINLAPLYTNCTAPTSVSASPISVAPGGSATLTWSGANGGTNNPITSYYIMRSTSASGSYSRVSSLDVTGLNVTGTDGTRTKTVPASSTNGETYYYKVQANASHNTALSSNYGSVTAQASSCSAPTDVSLQTTEATGGNVTLQWYGSEGGTNNSITGYKVQRRQYDGSAWGSYADLTTVSSTSAGTSASPITASVAVPDNLSYEYQYRVLTMGSAGASFYSDYTESSNTIKRICTLSTPTDLQIESATGTTAALSWSASTITGAVGTITYSIQKDGVQVAITTDTSYTAPESVTKEWGTSAVSLTVVATYSGYSSAASSAVLYTYSPTISPATNLSVNPVSGRSTTLTWTVGSLSNGGEVTSSILINDTVVSSELSVATFEITEALAIQYGPTLSIKVRTNGAGKTSDSSAVAFTYVAPHKFVKVYDGTRWVKCIPYYRDGADWREVEIRRFNGSSWDVINND